MDADFEAWCNRLLEVKVEVCHVNYTYNQPSVEVSTTS